MILVDNEIRDRVENYNKYKNVYCKEAKPIIKDFKLQNLQSSSYDITITNKIDVFQNKIHKIRLDNKEDVDDASVEVDISLGYDLKPSEYILVRVDEWINMPNDLCARIMPRTTFTRIGLIVSSQYFNPSYSGKVQLGLYNTTNSVIEIKPNLKIGQIVFETLHGVPNEDNLYCNKGNSKYQNEKGSVGSRIYEEIDSEFMKHLNSL
jgi:dCTP deaminase